MPGIQELKLCNDQSGWISGIQKQVLSLREMSDEEDVYGQPRESEDGDAACLVGVSGSGGGCEAFAAGTRNLRNAKPDN